MAARFSRAVRAFRESGAARPGHSAGPITTGGNGSESDRSDEATRRLIARMSRAHLSGELAGRATHEISNHLQVVLGNAELLSLGATLSDDSRRQLAWIIEAGRAAAAVNGALRELSLGEDGTPAGPANVPLSLGEALTRTAPRLDWLVSPAHLDTSTIGTDVRAVRLSAAVSPDLLCELLLRLARQARLAPGATATLRAELLPPPPNATSSDAEAPDRRAPARWLRLGIRIDAPSGTAPADRRASASTRSGPEPSASRTKGTGGGVSLDILATLVGLAGGRADAAAEAGGSTRSPPDLVLPVELDTANR